MKPVLTIVAGSNGCGKTTLTSAARDESQLSPVLDPDAILKSVHGSIDSQIQAGKHILQQAEELLRTKQSFTVETTLSGSPISEWRPMPNERASLSWSSLWAQVRSRLTWIVFEHAFQGGHDIPEETQRRRWPRTLKNMRQLLLLADQILILDDSTDNGYSMVGVGRLGEGSWIEAVPEWALPLRDVSATTDPAL